LLAFRVLHTEQRDSVCSYSLERQRAHSTPRRVPNAYCTTKLVLLHYVCEYVCMMIDDSKNLSLKTEERLVLCTCTGR
jgi:hypothetical protein